MLAYTYHLKIFSSGWGTKIPILHAARHGQKKKKKFFSLVNICKDFPGGAVVKNPPANAGDMGLSPGPGRYHVPWSN